MELVNVIQFGPVMVLVEFKKLLGVGSIHYFKVCALKPLILEIK